MRPGLRFRRALQARFAFREFGLLASLARTAHRSSRRRVCSVPRVSRACLQYPRPVLQVQPWPVMAAEGAVYALCAIGGACSGVGGVLTNVALV